PEPGVATRREDLEDAATQPEDRDVEGPAAEIVDRDDALVLLVEAVGERSRRRLVHQTEHLQAREPSGVPGRLPLAVVEVGRHRDHRLRDALPERRLGPTSEL